MLACQDCKEGQHGIARRNQPKGLLLSIQHGEGGQSTRKKQKRPNEAATVSRRAVGTRGVGRQGAGGGRGEFIATREFGRSGMCGIFGFCLLSFPQNERRQKPNIPHLDPTQTSTLYLPY